MPREGILARAFWALTLYEIDPLGGLYFAENPIKRYSISNRTQGVEYNKDGTLTFTISYVTPPIKTNWLPAPKGKFALFMRAYLPEKGLIDGTIDFPNINVA